MARRTTLKGKNVMLFVNSKAIALATSCELTLNANTEDAATKDDGGFSNYEVTGHDWSITSDNLVGADETTPTDLSFTELMDLCLAGTTVTVMYGLTASTADEVPTTGWTVPSSGYTGSAVIESVKQTDQNKQNATMSISLKGKGVLSKISA